MALRAAAEIADDLRLAAGRSAATSTTRLNRQLSLGGGQAGVALLFAYLHAVEPGRGHDDVAVDLVERSAERMGELPPLGGLYGGFAGVSWVVEHLHGWILDPEGEDAGEEVAEALTGLLGGSRWWGEYDLITGLVGYGAYALERLPRPGGGECLEAVVARLAETAEHRPEGVAWKTPPERLMADTRTQFPHGNYNVGVAHGVPGVMALLAASCAAGVAEREARPLLAAALAWLLAQRLPPEAGSIFPYSVAPGVEPSTTRLAWCYGDLGIAAALLAAARFAAEPAWEREALAIARAAAARPPATAGVPDAGLCHGAAGVAHLFNRLFQASGEPALAAAARTWFGEALALRRPGEGIGGYRLLTADEHGALAWRDEPGFLQGAAGIALALLAAATPVEPLWDRLLLAAIPPR
jgi:class I lanthipeptide synthase